MRYSLLMLFLGYYGSITLFPHAHHIENGVTIVHSHPFNSGSDKNPVNHQHTPNGYILIQLLSNFVSTVIFLGLLIEVSKIIISKYILPITDECLPNLFILYSNGLRAPPASQIH